jgi:hypothetical protein
MTGPCSEAKRFGAGGARATTRRGRRAAALRAAARPPSVAFAEQRFERVVPFDERRFDDHVTEILSMPMFCSSSPSTIVW